MKIKSSLLLDELMLQTERATESVLRFQMLTDRELNHKKSAAQWSLLECIEHLNRYGDFYLPEIEKQILKKPAVDEDREFRSGWIGNYFVQLVQVGNGAIKKMKTPAAMDPLHSTLSKTTLSRFLKQQQRLLTLLEQAAHADLTRTKTAISLTPFIKLRLGDTLRFVVAHIERHIKQAEATQR